MDTRMTILYWIIAILLVLLLHTRMELYDANWKLERVAELGAAAFQYMKDELKEPRSVQFVHNWMLKKIEEEEENGHKA